MYPLGTRPQRQVLLWLQVERIHEGATEANRMNASFEARLAVYLKTKLPEAEDLAISELTKTTEGLSYETYTLQASWRRGGRAESQGFAVRVQPEHGPVPPYDAEPQFRILQALYGSGVPVPRVFWLEKDRSILGAPFFVMEKVEGEIPLPWKSSRSQAYANAQERSRLAQEFVRVLAALHTLDWKARGISFLREPLSPTDYARWEIERWERVQQENQYLAEPILEEALGWLKGHIPPAPCTTLVHGDFRVGNFFWREGHIAAFLDWEMVALGDPLSDLAWVGMKAFRANSPLACGLLDRQELHRRYQELTGIEVAEASIYFWEVLGNVKLFAILVAGLRAYVDRIRPDIRLAIFEFDALHHLNNLAQLLGF